MKEINSENVESRLFEHAQIQGHVCTGIKAVRNGKLVNNAFIDESTGEIIDVDKGGIVEVCQHLGVAATTPTFIRKTGDLYEARCGVSILGQTNLSQAELETADPFDENFHDNFAIGTGPTEAEALADLADCCLKMSNSLWI